MSEKCERCNEVAGQFVRILDGICGDCADDLLAEQQASESEEAYDRAMFEEAVAESLAAGQAYGGGE